MKVTFQQGKGRWNSKYWTALFHFEDEDKHFFLRKEKSKCNWMPKHSEIKEMIHACILVEPQDKREILKNMFLETIDDAFDKPHSYN